MFVRFVTDAQRYHKWDAVFAPVPRPARVSLGITVSNERGRGYLEKCYLCRECVVTQCEAGVGYGAACKVHTDRGLAGGSGAICRLLCVRRMLEFSLA